MIGEISKELYDFLKSKSEFTTVMGSKIFPIIALEGNATPLTTYRIIENRPLSKDGTNASIELFFWFNIEQYEECVAFTDAMTTLLKTKYFFVSSTIDISEDTKHYHGIINIEKK